MIIDKLYNEVEKKGSICVGLDTDISYIPKKYFEDNKVLSDVIFEFNKDIIDSTKDLVAIYKLQIAYYEKAGIQGLIAYSKTLEYLKSQNILSIGDIKRGDIAATADAYCSAHFEGKFEADFITLSPYMGFDTIEPFMDQIKNNEKGVFVLVRTSNPGAKDIEELRVDEEFVYDKVATGLEAMSAETMGECGYSSIGAVVGGTNPEELQKIRQKYKKLFFLIPGYGAQGGEADVLVGLDENHNGAIVNSSRGIITNHQKHDSDDVKKYSRLAVESMREDLKVGL